MPWCDDCSRFWNPPDMSEGGNCPKCGRFLVAPVGGGTQGGGQPEQTASPPAGGSGSPPARAPAGSGAAVPGQATPTTKAKGAPWHFKVLVVGVTIYMIYRIYWLIEWLPKHI